METIPLNIVPLSDEIAALPEVLGSGNVNSLRQAMEQDVIGCFTVLAVRGGLKEHQNRQFNRASPVAKAQFRVHVR